MEMAKFINLEGQKFSRLLVIKRAENKVFKCGTVVAQWICKCDCGKENIIVASNKLRNGNTKSCGCLHDELFEKNRMLHMKHNKSNTRLYKIWSGMKQRCHNSRHPKYRIYGKRGIVVCDEWKNSFEKFYNWAIEHGYKDNLTIDRIDNDRNYEPNNCRWFTPKEQSNNVRHNLIYSYNGQRKTLKQLAEEYNINYGTLYSRVVRDKWGIDKALNTPLKRRKK